MNTLDVSTFPRRGITLEGQDMSKVVRRMRTSLTALSNKNLIKRNESFGFAVAIPQLDMELYQMYWDYPREFVWFVAGWGPQADRYIANAVRKLRPALRTGRDTMDLRVSKPGRFKDAVESQEEDGTFAWGDFPYGGATFVKFGGLIIPTSVSCLREVEDDAVAKMFGGFMGAAMFKASNPDDYNPD